MIKEQTEWYKEQIDRDALSFRAFPEEARRDRELVKYALDKSPFNMWYISDFLKNDKSYAMTVLAEYPTFHMNKLSPQLQSDPEMVLFAMKRNQTFDLMDLENVCKNFAHNQQIMDQAFEKLQENPLMAKGEIRIGQAMMASYMGKDKVMNLVRENPESYRLLSAEMKEDPQIALEAIKRAPYLVNEVPASLQTTPFRTAVVMSVPAAENELSLRHRREVLECKENLQKPSKLQEIVHGVKQKDDRNIDRREHRASHRSYNSIERDER